MSLVFAHSGGLTSRHWVAAAWSGRVGGHTGAQRAFDRAVHLLSAWEEPLVRVVAFVTVFIDGERPAVGRARVLEATDVADLPVVAPIQVEERALIAWPVGDVGILENLAVKGDDARSHLRLDRIGNAGSWHAPCALSAASHASPSSLMGEPPGAAGW